MKNRIFCFERIFVSVSYICVVSFLSPKYAQENRNLLTESIEKIDKQDWAENSVGLFQDKLSISNQLDLLLKGVKEQIRRNAEEALSFNWPSIPVTAYLDYVRNGDRTRMKSFQNQRTSALKDLVLGELLTKEGRYLDGIMDGTWAICEQSTWVLSAHLSAQEGGFGVPNINDPVIDLGVGEVANLLSWIYFYFKDEFENISPLLAERIEDEIDERIITPYLEREDFWWMGFESSFVNN